MMCCTVFVTVPCANSGRRGRGGGARGRGRGQSSSMPSKEQLDAELDAYNSKVSMLLTLLHFSSVCKTMY